ncbi:hypothetical protein [Sphingosinicella sp. BN140058]|uniref:hypothetical protein n=1 Tax=Sphingosinicella sp. BN140058 TaxID=1892855 RepID=UPI0010124BED|nr:hypothetical protein [Sphingosinicella sp. BN140058]QAY75188.1 hypothetical protein ETR14_00560 [Sphingosinicella sp. BN140058]
MDVREDVLLCRSLEEGGCAGDGLGGDTLFAAGASDRFITLAVHQRTWPRPKDLARTDDHYLIRSPDEAADGGRCATLECPFDERTFANEKRRLGMPEFARVFQELK